MHFLSFTNLRHTSLSTNHPPHRETLSDTGLAAIFVQDTTLPQNAQFRLLVHSVAAFRPLPTVCVPQNGSSHPAIHSVANVVGAVAKRRGSGCALRHPSPLPRQSLSPGFGLERKGGVSRRAGTSAKCRRHWDLSLFLRDFVGLRPPTSLPAARGNR